MIEYGIRRYEEDAVKVSAWVIERVLGVLRWISLVERMEEEKPLIYLYTSAVSPILGRWGGGGS